MTILEENNLIKAAELLYLSPSTAGARLRAMEDELGFELFERKRGVKTALPTPKGQDLSLIHICVSAWRNPVTWVPPSGVEMLLAKLRSFSSNPVLCISANSARTSSVPDWP